MAKTKKYKDTIELYINDKLYKAVPQDKWDTELNKLSHILRMKGYTEQYNDLNGFNHLDSYAAVWINWKTLKILVISHKARTEFTDKNGIILYVDDIVDYNGLQSRFNKKPWDEGYYVREVFHHPGGDSWQDTDIDESNIGLIKKLKDVNGFQKQYWNSPETFDTNTL